MQLTTPRNRTDRQRSLRVLLVGINYAPESSGIAPYTTALARGLAARGHEVRVLTTMPHYPEWRIPAEYTGRTRRETIDGVAITRLRHYVPSRPAGVRRLLSELSFGMRVLTARWHRPDVVVFVSPALFASAIGVWRARSSFRAIPTVVWTQDLYSLGIVETGSHRTGSTVERVITATERYVARSTDAAVVIHDRFAQSASRLGASRDGIRVIRNWSHLEPGVSRGRGRVRRLLGWDDDELIVLHTGNMGVKQDLGNLVEAAREAQSRGLHLRFVVMGDGSQRAALQQLAAGADLIEFVDPLPSGLYLDALRSADVLVVNEAPGLREMAVPSKLTSYFTAGRPVVAATDAASITAAEVSASGAGVRVEPARPTALLDAVLAVAGDPAASTAYGDAGRAYQRNVLSEQAAIDAFEEFLATLTEPPHHAADRRGHERTDPRRTDHDRLARASL